MANILLLDDNMVAGRAMEGILARGHHTGFVAADMAEAWRRLREGVVFDLVILELRIAGGGLTFLQQLRSDWFWKIMPVVVYTTDSDSRQVKRALALGIQNYLIKPFNDQLIYSEIAKAMKNPWRDLHYEEVKSYCAMMSLTPETLRSMRRDVMLAFDKAAHTYPKWADERRNEQVFEEINALIAAAEAAGIWAGVDYLRHLLEEAAQGRWSVFARCAEYLDYASRLTFCQLNPAYVPESMRTERELIEAKQAAECARWFTSDVDVTGPVVNAATLKKQCDALPGWPVIDTVSAAFQMVADGRVSNMTQVMDLIASDPGLCAEVLVAANHIEHDDMTVIEDSRAGATLLGELRLQALGKMVPTAIEARMEVAPLNWPNYWMFQVAVGRVAQFICSYLDLEYLSANAYTAGLIHDIGRMLVLQLHPYGFQAIVRHARERKISLAEAEKKYVGMTARELAVYFAENRGLPAIYVDVLRSVDNREPGQGSDLVAIVSLARDICLHAGVGVCGDPAARYVPIPLTPAWQILQPRLFPSFDVKKFEVQAHAFCLTLRSQLSGSRTERRFSHADRAAELV